MTIYGYARVSTGRQETENQTSRLRTAGAETIVEEVVSGASRALPMRDALLASLTDGDELIVVGVDRLGRRASDVLHIAEDLDARGVRLHLLREGIDTSTATGRMVLGVMASLAQMERELLIERTQDGLARARRAGKRLGRPPALSPAQVRHAGELAERGVSIAETQELLGASRATVVRARRAYRESVDRDRHRVA